jgi:cytochrome b involved in lipid metabolism
MESTLQKIPRQEFLKNNGEGNNKLWVLIHGHVYDVSNFKHPGGREILLDEHGEDRGDEFDSIHSASAKKDLKQRLIGILVEDEKPKQIESKLKKTDDEIKTKETSISNLILPFILVGLIVFWFIFNNYNKSK